MTNIQYALPNMLSRSISGFLCLPSSLLSIIALLPMSASGQTATATPSLALEATTAIPISRSQTGHIRSEVTSFATSTVSNNTIALSTTTNKPIPKDILPNTTQTENTNEGAFRYYWLILALFGVSVAFFLWWANRRRIKRKEQMRLSGQNALARDMEGWINTRRWYHGAWASNQTRAFIRREEGLNEHGEAPPPYRRQGEATVTQDFATGLLIPLSTLSREQMDAGHPPEYRETASRDHNDAERPDTVVSHTNRPPTAGSPPRSSIRPFIQDRNG